MAGRRGGKSSFPMKWKAANWYLAAAVSCVLWSSCLAQEVGEETRALDTLEPIVRRSIAPPGDYFGYSMTMHQTSSSSMPRFSESVEGARIIVGAPRGISSFENATYGLVYECDITPGSCKGLTGNDLGNDRRLFDKDDNNIINMFGDLITTEDKSSQLMGATVVSNGDNFMACAPHWISTGGGDEKLPVGRCFLSGRDLINFAALQPCDGTGSLTQIGGSYCMAGTSAVVFDSTVVLGTPGHQRLTGSLYQRSTTASGTDPYTSFTDNDFFPAGIFNFYYGIATTFGHVTSLTDYNVISAAPRFDGIAYFGKVIISGSDVSMPLGSIIVEGLQNGEFFGQAVAAADLNGDGYDEVIVGAPMYSSSVGSEWGRVFIFKNTGGNLSSSDPIILNGTVSSGRFGFSVVNIGDANDDSYEDIAIGAPYAGTDDGIKGMVYIYYGTAEPDFINTDPQQTITASDVVSGVESLNALTSFGYSLSSGTDIDGNGYNDLLVGAYESQAVFLFRTMSRIEISVENITRRAVSGSPSGSKVNLNDTDCYFNDTAYACFDVNICALYTGRGYLDDQPFSALVDVQELVYQMQNRLFFVSEIDDTKSYSIQDDFVLDGSGVLTCQNYTVYIEDAITERQRDFELSVELSIPERLLASVVDGNQSLADLQLYPILNLTGETTLAVPIELNCGVEQICVSDLFINITDVLFYGDNQERTDRFVVGEIQEIGIILEYGTLLEDAFNSRVEFTLPLQFDFRQREDSLMCAVVNPMTKTYSCLLQNPNPLASRTTYQSELRWRVIDSAFVGDEGSVDVSVQIALASDSDNFESENATAPNSAKYTITVEAEALLRLDLMFDPNSLTYSSETEDRNSIVSVGDLGPMVSLFMSIRNNGPTEVQSSELVFYIPFQSPETGMLYYIYPVDTSVTCEGPLNPEGFNATGATGGGRRRRSTMRGEVRQRRRDSIKRRHRRQESMEQTSEIIQILCSDEEVRAESCFMFRCSTGKLQINTLYTITLNAYIDERFLNDKKDTYEYGAYGMANILDDYIQTIRSNQSDTDEDTVRVSQFITVTRDPLLIWPIIVAVIVAVFLLILIFIALYFCGFLRRKKRPRHGVEVEEVEEKPAGVGDGVVSDGVKEGGGEGGEHEPVKEVSPEKEKEKDGIDGETTEEKEKEKEEDPVETEL